jgi:hypothetical protein
MRSIHTHTHQGRMVDLELGQPNLCCVQQHTWAGQTTSDGCLSFCIVFWPARCMPAVEVAMAMAMSSVRSERPSLQSSAHMTDGATGGSAIRCSSEIGNGMGTVRVCTAQRFGSYCRRPSAIDREHETSLCHLAMPCSLCTRYCLRTEAPCPCLLLLDRATTPQPPVVSCFHGGRSLALPKMETVDLYCDVGQ